MTGHCFARIDRGLLVLCAAVCGLGGCREHELLPTSNNNGNGVTTVGFSISTSARPEPMDLDLLFVVDNSNTMAREQEALAYDFAVLVDAIENTAWVKLNLHIGVVTTDLGTANYTTIRYCHEVGGDRGVLGKVDGVNLAEACIGNGQRFIVDVAPEWCSYDISSDRTCGSHDCTQEDCEQVGQLGDHLNLVTDGRGCPRCRNFSGTLEEVFSCVVRVGTEGCGFEQPLEAMRKSLDAADTPENRLFLREGAHLAVVVLADEDDCSASRPDVIFNPDPAESRLDSSVGYLHSFRCFEFGVTCDIDDRTQVGPRGGCVPRDDEEALLHPVSRFTAFLEALRDPYQLVVAAIAGPHEGQVVVERDDRDRPFVAPVCTDADGAGVAPGVRLKAFVEHFASAQDVTQWAYADVCSNRYYGPLQRIGRGIGGAMHPGCLLDPLAGCPRGPSGTVCAACFPECTVSARELYVADRATLLVPWCGRLCRDGMCTQDDLEPCRPTAHGRCWCEPPLYPTIVDGQKGCAPLHYPGGLPTETTDPALENLLPRIEPTCHGSQCPEGTEGRASACWYLENETACPFKAVPRVVTAREPAVRTYFGGWCVSAPTFEEHCWGGVDDDEDCLTDLDDPDCAS